MFEGKLTHEMVKSIHQPRKPREIDYTVQLKKVKNTTTTLAEYIPSENAPWNMQRVFHVLKRLQFGASYSESANLLASTPTEFIDQLIDQAIAAELPVAPDWINKIPPPQGSSEEAFLQYFEENFPLYNGYMKDWLDLMLVEPFREKMVLFWHNHFVTEIGKYEHAPLAYRYLTTLRIHAFGNFKDFVHAIGLDSAMLIYLDGVENHDGSPNENYARELLELFTMGIGNYTETDIREIARALTGHYFDFHNLTTPFWSGLYDGSEKSFFGRTGNFDYDDVIDIIFEERESEIAQFICTKLYKFFVYEFPNQTIVDQLAQTFISNNFEIEPVIRQLLKSEHFFDEVFMGAMLKSPVDYMLGLQKETGESLDESLRDWQPYQLYDLGQYVLNPINVAGWPGYRSWISTTTLPQRWFYNRVNLYHSNDEYRVDAIELAKQVSEDPANIAQLAYDLADYLLSVEIPTTERNALPGILKGWYPYDYWDINSSNQDELESIRWRILDYLVHLRELPEYQLM